MVSNTLLALSALLLLAGARARQCEEGPVMTVAGPTVRDNSTRTHKARHGKNVELFCSFHDSEYLNIGRRMGYLFNNGENLPTSEPAVSLNTTTISVLLRPALGHYTYICADSKSGCERSLTIDHIPAMHVSSARAIIKMFDTDFYFIDHGDHFQVICAGPKYEMLHIYLLPNHRWSTEHNELHTDVVNDTSVAYSALANRTGEFLYECSAGDKVPQPEEFVWVLVDYFPEAHNCSCVYLENQFDCSWRPSNARTTFKMFYNDKLVCFSIAGENTGGCVWENMFMGRELVETHYIKFFSVMLETCNKLICNNQTFTMPFNSIRKTTPVHDFHVISTSTRDVLLAWKNWCDSDSTCSNKVEYRLSAFGETWRQADTSSVQCDDYSNCEFRLAPLYPDSKYKVRVTRRYREATDDRLWSDPTSVSLVTKPREECACEASKGTSESITRDSACEACLLEDHIDKETSALNEHKMKLKKKRDTINGYIKRIKVLETID